MDFLSAYGICMYYLPESLLWSLIADAVDYQAYLTGQRNDGTVYATITFIVFFAASASTSIIALLLEAVGYDPTLGSMGQLAGVPEKIKMLGAHGR